MQPAYPTMQKVTASHLDRDAYLYVRQSSLRKVVEHGESTQRQYALRERALALGRKTPDDVFFETRPVRVAAWSTAENST